MNLTAEPNGNQQELRKETPKPLFDKGHEEFAPHFVQ